MATKSIKVSGNLKHSDSGMTLIDLAVFMMVLGLLAVPLIQQYNNMMANRGKGITENNNVKIKKAMDDFYFVNGRYPCPSNINLPRNDPNYGREATGTICANPPVLNQTVTGGVPFADLKLPEAVSLDGWNNRVQYTVTDRLRSAATFNPPNGAITVRGFQTGTDPVTQASFCIIPPGPNPVPNWTLTTQAHYALVSFGPTARGAIPREGGAVPVQACPAAGTSRDAENCNGDLIFVTNFNRCAGSDIPGPTFYDDVIDGQFPPGPQRIWVYNNNTVTDIASVATKIGINLPPNAVPWPDGMWDNLPAALPPSAVRTGVDVYGNILATQTNPTTGRIITNSICNRLGQRCFNPESIAGTLPQMDCSNGVNPNNNGARNMALTGFRDLTVDVVTPGTYDNGGADGTAAVCRSIYNPAAAGTCPAGQFARGILANGRINCQP